MIKKGSVISIAAGQYDDYGIDAMMNVIADFDMKEQHSEWRKVSTHYDIPPTYRCKILRVKDTAVKFTDWLVGKGFCEEIEYEEFLFDEHDLIDMYDQEE